LHDLERNRALDNYYLLPASLGEFYQELGEVEEARAYFRRAQELTRSAGIREVLQRKISLL
jgi:predicted RNA polymerase sigma factor